MIKPVENSVTLEVFGKQWTWGNGKQWVLMAGPDIFESESLVREVASELSQVTRELGIPWILKCSFDKANRSSAKSFRGPSTTEALKGLARIREDFRVPLVTDVHETSQVESVAAIADVLQIPAFLCRQTDLLVAAARTGKVLHVKKGQFLAPWDMKGVVEKVSVLGGNRKLLLCERGTTFGYNRLVNDFCGLPEMRSQGFPVVMDATHSVQQPGALGSSSGGNRDMIEVLARAAMAVGVDGLFFETHPNPDQALCDGPNSLNLKDMKRVLSQLQTLWKTLQGLEEGRRSL